MREYEIVVLYDLSVAESGGADAAPTALTTLIEARGGSVLKVDHWGRRRMAYPIKNSLDADYVVMRADVDPSSLGEIEAALRINESVYRHLVVRADEIPIPPPPREPRLPRAEGGEEGGDSPAAVEAPAATAEAAPAEAAPAPEPVAEAEAAEPAAEASEPVAEAVAEEPAVAEASVDEAAADEPVAEAADESAADADEDAEAGDTEAETATDDE